MSEKYGSSGEPGIQLPATVAAKHARRADQRRLDDLALAELVHVQADEQRDRDRAGDGERAPRAAGHGLRRRPADSVARLPPSGASCEAVGILASARPWSMVNASLRVTSLPFGVRDPRAGGNVA